MYQIAANGYYKKEKEKLQSEEMEHQILANGRYRKERLQQDQGEKEQEQQKAYLERMEKRLELKRQRLQRPTGGESLRPCVFKFIGNLGSISGGEYQRPHMMSIGPYHRGKDNVVIFEDKKWYFLTEILSRTSKKLGRDLDFFLKEMRGLETSTRECYFPYGDVDPLSGYDFVEMMLLDGCFIIELLRFLGKSEDGIDEDGDVIIFTRTSATPLVIADLIKLENQLPFFVLESLFNHSRTSEGGKELLQLIEEAIRLIFPLPAKTSSMTHPPKHLLELVYKSLLPKADTTSTTHQKQCHHSSNEVLIIQCVAQLRPSGIKFKPKKSEPVFLDIKFENGVLEIPTVTINNFTMNLIVNCLAWEQCSKDGPTYFTDYIYFMNCLINGPRDAALLCADGIIKRHSRDDADVASYFSSLGKNIVVLNTGTSYLSKEMRDIEAYYRSNWATIMRTLTIHNRPSLQSSLP